MSKNWGGDLPPSMPEVLQNTKYVDFGGFCWTDGGIAHDISQSEVDELRIPGFAPPPDVTR